MFCNKILEEENDFLTTLAMMEQSGLKICIYGAAQGAKHIIYQLEINGIKWDKMLVDNCGNDNDVVNIDDYFNEVTGQINLIVSFSGFREEKISRFIKKIKYISVHDSFYGNIDTVIDYMDKKWVIDNNDNLEWMYNNLDDELSKRSLIAYINEKISYKFGYLEDVYCADQYFPPDIIKLKKSDIFLDCGAFDGDTIRNLYTVLNKYYDIHNITKVLAIEADPHNFYLLQRNVKNKKNIECINMAVSDKYGELFFSGDNEQFRQDMFGRTVVLSDTIDHILKGGKVTYIKMDIEGAELSALKGAKETIKNYKPKLGICVYHKKEDLFYIAQYIKSIVPEYKFYMRAHSKNNTDLVLYALV